MVEDLRSLREAALAIDGLKSTLEGKLSLLIWIVSGFGVVGLAVAGGLFYMINDLSVEVARTQAQGVILEDIKTTLERMAPPPVEEPDQKLDQ